MTCWLPDRTPLKVRMRLKNILTGFEWRPGMPEPPNGTHILDQTGACEWWKISGTKIAIWRPATIGTTFTFLMGGVIYAFVHANPLQCIIAGENQMINGPGCYYYSGHARITWQG